MTNRWMHENKKTTSSTYNLVLLDKEIDLQARKLGEKLKLMKMKKNLILWTKTFDGSLLIVNK